jgi:hypothetical protein
MHVRETRMHVLETRMHIRKTYTRKQNPHFQRTAKRNAKPRKSIPVPPSKGTKAESLL